MHSAGTVLAVSPQWRSDPGGVILEAARLPGMMFSKLMPFFGTLPGLGSVLDTVSKDTEDTAHSCILSVSKIHFQPTCFNGI